MIKILQNGIKHDNGYTPCFYSMGNNSTCSLQQTHIFTGTKVDVVKQIGNAVPPNFARALFGQILKETTL